MSKIIDVIKDDDLIDLYFNKHLGLREICKTYNINTSNYANLGKRLKHMGYKLRKNKPRKINTAPIKEIISLYNNGFSMRDIVKHFNNDFGIQIVSEILKTNNVYIRNNSGIYNKNYNGGKFKIAYGYIKVRDPNYPKSDTNGYVLEHVKVYEQYTKTSLKKGDVIHHIDLDKENNNITNLYKMSLKEHGKLHSNLNDIVSKLIKMKIIKFKNGVYYTDF